MTSDNLHSLLEEYARRLSTDGGLSPHTRKAYVAGLRRFLEWRAHRDAEGPRRPESTWRGEIVAEFAAAVESGEVLGNADKRLAPATLRQTLAAINRYHRYRNGDRVSPRGCMSVHLPARLPRALLGSELARWDASVEELDYDRGRRDVTARMRVDRDKAILAVLRYAGLRSGEVESLNINDVILHGDKRLRVEGRGGKRQIVPSAPVTKPLETYRHQRQFWPGADDTAAFFLTGRGGRYQVRSVAQLVEGIAVKAGLADVSPQTLRHTFATELTQLQGVPLVDAAEILGVSSLGALRVYRRLMRRHAYAVADGVERLAAAVADRPHRRFALVSLRIEELAMEWGTIAECAQARFESDATGILAVERDLTAIYHLEDRPRDSDDYGDWRAAQQRRAIAVQHALTQARAEIDRQWDTEPAGRRARRTGIV